MNAETPRTLDYWVERMVALREHIRETENRHKEELKKPKETMAKLEAVVMASLQAQGVDSARTGSGTVFLSSKKNASLADADLFMKFVINGKLWDLIDRKANASAVADYIDENGNTPPGVNYSVRQTLNLRKA